MATTPSKVSPEDDVPPEIQEHVARYMIRWEGYLTQDKKDKEQVRFYTRQLQEETEDIESRKFFKSKIASAEASRRAQKENLTDVYEKVRQIVSAVCKEHNDALLSRQSRKRKSAAPTSERGTPEIEKIAKKSKPTEVVAASARQETAPTPTKQPTPSREKNPTPRQTAPPPRQPTPPP